MRYRKKPVVIESFRLGFDECPRWAYSSNKVEVLPIGSEVRALIHTLEGTMKANHGDYIIQGVQGEIYPCKPDIFEATYEAVTNDA